MGCHTMRRFMVVAVPGPGIRIVERVFSVALLRCRCSGCCWAEKLQLHPTIAHQSLANPSRGWRWDTAGFFYWLIPTRPL